MKKTAERLLDILYPRHCPLCHRILKEKNRTICPECETKAVPIEGARCFRCGRPVLEEEEFCGECRTHAHQFDSGRGIFLYSSRWRSCVVRFKYYGCREYGDFLGDAMAFYARRERQRNLADAFAVTKPVKGWCILVVDDVFTTGSTMDAMAKCLKKAGAFRVHFLTAFMGHGK